MGGVLREGRLTRIACNIPRTWEGEMRLGASVVTQSNNRASSGNVVFQRIVIHILRMRSVDLHVYIYDYMS
jgi:hypothetical protein